jgi:taurine dioxygenase
LSISIRRLSYSLGAEVIGIDLTLPVDETIFREINNILLEYHVVLFRGQSISRAQHVELARCFGELIEAPKSLQSETHPEVSIVINKPTDNLGSGVIGGEWHSDRAECPCPAAASLLRCVKLPGIGGDTMFANMHKAYDELSPGMKELLGNLEGVYLDHSPDFDLGTPERYLESRLANPAAAHPAVRSHAESGRKMLFVNAETNHFVNMTEDESRPLIRYITERATRPENVYRHQWHEDDLVIWDNRSVLHMALADYDRSKVRHMERVAVIGDESGYAYFGPIGAWPSVDQLLSPQDRAQ